MARTMQVLVLLGLVALASACEAAVDAADAGDTRGDVDVEVSPDVPGVPDVAAATDATDDDPGSDVEAIDDHDASDAVDTLETSDAPDTDATPGPTTLSLDPATLQFFSLPIGSYRPAISGLDPAARTCVTLIWMFDDVTMGSFCGTPDVAMAYAIVTPDTDGPCGEWEYGGGLGILELEGCADWREFGPGHVDLADLTAHLALAPGEPPVYDVTVDNRAAYDPPPVTLGLRYSTDIPEDVWVQSVDAYGLPGWARVLRDGQPLVLFDRCDLPVCGEQGGVCGQAFTQVHNVTHTSYAGQVVLTWDGRVRVEDPVDHCWKREPAPAGAYELEACFSWQVEETGSGKVVVAPTCRTAPFTLPASEAWVHADLGG